MGSSVSAYGGGMAAALPPIAGIDIDGVVADPTHRLHHLEGRPKNWRAFFAESDDDPALPQGVAAVADLAASGLAIVYVSGRPNRLRRPTAAWLRRNGLPEGPLHLRPARDFRRASVLKPQIYSDLARRFVIRTILDDDAAVVAALRAAGFPAVLADWYRPPSADHDALSDAQDRQGRT
jgi:hypothetical protein